MKKLLPAFTIESLVHGIKPDLRAEKYGEALESLIVQVGLVLASDCAKNGNCYEHEEKEGIDWWLALVLAVFVLLGVGQFWWGRREARVRGEVAEKLRKLQKDLKVLLLLCFCVFVPRSDHTRTLLVFGGFFGVRTAR